jgi:O-antigen/teichoic acid export membrane protein
LSTIDLIDAPVDADKHGKFRNHRIKLAAATSIGSKCVTIAVNVFAMPLALHALGVTKFGVYSMLAATLSWVGMAQIGIGPGLTIGIARSHALGENELETRYFSSAVFTIAAIVAIIGTILLACIWSLPTTIFFGSKINIATIPELKMDMTCFVIFILSRILLSVFDAAQAGYQEQYVCSLWMMLGNTLSLLSLVFVARTHPLIIGIIVAMNAMPIIADACNGTRLIFIAHPNLRPRLRCYDWGLAKSLLSNGIAFSSVMGSSYIMYACGTLLIGRMDGAKSAALYAVLQQGYTMGLGVVGMFLGPLWPALNDAKARGDRKWAIGTFRRVILFGMLYAGLFGGSVALFGHKIFNIWYHSRIDVHGPILYFYGLYFILAIWENVQYTVLVGMNSLKIAAIVMIARSFLMLAIAPFLINKFGDVGLSSAMCIAQLALSAWIFPILTRRALSEEAFYK